MNQKKSARTSDMTGSRVVIHSGRYAGKEGICVGKSTDGNRSAISLDGSDVIVQLIFEEEFGLLVDLSSDPERS